MLLAGSLEMPHLVMKSTLRGNQCMSCVTKKIIRKHFLVINGLKCVCFSFGDYHNLFLPLTTGLSIRFKIGGYILKVDSYGGQIP